MQRFKNILVGIDLQYTDQFVSTALSLPCAEAVECAMALAKRNDARITFFHAFDVSNATQRVLSELGADDKALQVATDFMTEMVQRATAQGLQSDVVVSRGRSWLEIIQQVIRGQHDLFLSQ
jgi:nucleotide-binding universal stress UspA family protein